MKSWLEARTRGAPGNLRARVLELAVAAAPSGSAAEALSGPGTSRAESLAGAGVRALEAVAASPGDRAVALDLLAADALMTLALLAQSEENPGGLDELARRLVAVRPLRGAGGEGGGRPDQAAVGPRDPDDGADRASETDGVGGPTGR